MANYLNKPKNENPPRTSFLQRGDGEVVPKNNNYNPNGDEDTTGVFRPANIDGKGIPQFVGYGGDSQEQTPLPTQTQSQTNGQNVPDLSQPDKTQAISEMISSGALGNSPYFDRLRENQAKLIQLETMPVTDENGRGKSGLKALVEKLSQYFDPRYPVRGGGDLYARLAGGVSAGITGAFVPDWDERSDIEKQKLKIKAENEELLKYGQADAQYRNQQAVLKQRNEQFNAKEGRLNKQLDDRIARNKMLTLKDEQKTTLEPIFKRGYYYEGDNPDEDTKLAKLNIILPDFDNTRKPITENGARKAWNPETRSYEPIQGTEIDPDEVPMTFQVDGEKITASAKYFLNYKAQKENRESNQTFQSSENEKNRQQQWKQFMETLKVTKAKTGFDRTKAKNEINKDFNDGKITQAEKDEAIAELDAQ